MAVVLSVPKWRHYLLGKKFTIISDQKALKFPFRTEGGSPSIPKMDN